MLILLGLGSGLVLVNKDFNSIDWNNTMLDLFLFIWVKVNDFCGSKLSLWSLIENMFACQKWKHSQLKY